MKALCSLSWVVLLAWNSVFAIGGPDSTEVFSGSSLNASPLTGKRYLLVFKISTLQVLYSEAPVSLEIFIHKNLSLQLQTGIIFPLEREHFLEQFFQSGGRNSTASSRGLISYRNSPYNNHGLSFKIELRKYFNSLYLSPQLMYKHCYYDDYFFDIYSNNSKIRQTESKRTNVGGLGLMIGRQTYFLRQATDWYVGAGIRARQIDAVIQMQESSDPPRKIVYPNSHEAKFSVYPFINFGFRTGLVF